jgi:hypothetical protein
MEKKDQAKYSEGESQQRFEAALRGAFATPATPMKSLSPKRPKKQRRPHKKATDSA